MDFSVHQRKGVLTDESAMQSDEWMDVPLSNIQKCAVMGGFKRRKFTKGDGKR
jgi:hypothetical protein